MKLKRAVDLARELGIPRRTVTDWCIRDPTLGVYIKGGAGGGSWWIKVEKLIGRHGIGPVDAYMLGSSHWMKAVDLAKLAGWKRRRVAKWCRDRPSFAKRIGRIYYIDLEALGMDTDTAITLLGNLGTTPPEDRVGST